MSNKLNIVLDATMFTTYQSCPAKFNYRFNHNYVTEVKAKPLDRGTLIHTGLEHYYAAIKLGKSEQDTIRAMTMAVNMAVVDSDLDALEINRILDVLMEHHEVWYGDDSTKNIVSVETPFMYTLFEDDNIRINMIGKIDLTYHDDKLNSLVVLDHKSYERDFPVSRLNDQFTNYAIATGSDYCVVNRIGFQKSIKPAVKHKRIFLSYDDEFKEQWKRNVVRIVYNYLNDVSDNIWPMNLTSCDKFNRKCEYHDICDTTGDENKIAKLNLHFKVTEPWDVSKSLGISND